MELFIDPNNTTPLKNLRYLKTVIKFVKKGKAMPNQKTNRKLCDHFILCKIAIKSQNLTNTQGKGLELNQCIIFRTNSKIKHVSFRGFYMYDISDQD